MSQLQNFGIYETRCEKKQAPERLRWEDRHSLKVTFKRVKPRNLFLNAISEFGNENFQYRFAQAGGPSPCDLYGVWELFWGGAFEVLPLQCI